MKVDVGAADQVAVQQALARYALALDQHDLDALRDLLTDDATWTFHFGGKDRLGPIVGPEAILALVRESAAAATAQQRHYVQNVALQHADASSAVVHAYLLLTAVEDGRPRIHGTGFYRFHLAKAEASWRIAELFLDTDNAW